MSEKNKEALEAFNGLDEWLNFLKNMLDEPPEVTMHNIPSIKADLTCATKDIRTHSLTICQALEQQSVLVEVLSNISYLCDNSSGDTLALIKEIADHHSNRGE